MKKILSLVLSLLLTASFGCVALACEIDTNTNCNIYPTKDKSQLIMMLLRGPVTPDNPYPDLFDVDYSTGVHYSNKLSVKEITRLSIELSSIFISSKSTRAILTTLSNLVPGGDLYIEYTQYLSKTIYHSDYYNTDYRKGINLDINIYYDDGDGKKLICGPYDGNWFDPIRP